MKVNTNTFREATIRTFIANKNDYPKIEDYTFSRARNLEELDLQRNGIQEISKHAFADCWKLKILDLSENKIQELKAGSFNCPTLEDLHLGKNRISQIKDQTFLGAENLNNLYLYQNEITGISDDGFKGLSGLQELRLSNNKLTHLKKEVLMKMGNLTSLYLAKNEIEVLNADTFAGNPMLKKIHLQGNQLKMIAEKTFDYLKLNELDLSGDPCIELINEHWTENCVQKYNRINNASEDINRKRTVDSIWTWHKPTNIFFMINGTMIILNILAFVVSIHFCRKISSFIAGSPDPNIAIYSDTEQTYANC
jgi:Leucine-rich repeat (LRR) protein